MLFEDEVDSENVSIGRPRLIWSSQIDLPSTTDGIKILIFLASTYSGLELVLKTREPSSKTLFRCYSTGHERFICLISPLWRISAMERVITFSIKRTDIR